MTVVLIALLVVVGVAVALDLVLTFGVIRRLRQHSEQLANLGGLGGLPPAVMLGAGEQASEFAATTTDGEPVSRELLSGQTLVGVFSPGCSACEEQLPRFVERAAAFPGGRAQVLAVVAGEPESTTSYRDRLAPVARVVTEAPTEGPLITALAVTGFPAFGLLDSDGMVVASGFAVDELPLIAPAAV